MGRRISDDDEKRIHRRGRSTHLQFNAVCRIVATEVTVDRDLFWPLAHILGSAPTCGRFCDRSRITEFCSDNSMPGFAQSARSPQASRVGSYLTVSGSLKENTGTS